MDIAGGACDIIARRGFELARFTRGARGCCTATVAGIADSLIGGTAIRCVGVTSCAFRLRNLVCIAYVTAAEAGTSST